MAIGTAGYTAMLCVMALERHGLEPARGPVLVTGAAGGVGSVAIALLAGRAGASSPPPGGRRKRTTSRGSARPRSSTGRAVGPRAAAGQGALGGGGGLGGLAHPGERAGHDALRRRGRGLRLAQGMDLPGSVAPFILRGVSLLGVDSVMAPVALRARRGRGSRANSTGASWPA
jgi:acrylyl-CoA reductase (NADPH)